MKRVFYFNITYTCNSNCVFCYSHNTIHSGKEFGETNQDDFIDYLKRKGICDKDRVVINGGEPFLHSHIEDILLFLKETQCEVLIYTNGRLLASKDLSFLNERFRFIIPVHGYKELHDKITRAKGSFEDMKNGLISLSKIKCLTDLKIILNHEMVMDDVNFEKTILDIDGLVFNNAIHLTKMADTVVSIRNNCSSVSLDQAAKYTNRLFEHFKDKCVSIKIFDTCIKDLNVGNFTDVSYVLEVNCKDYKDEWQVQLSAPEKSCESNCKNHKYCLSAVDSYIALEYEKGNFYKGLE